MNIQSADLYDALYAFRDYRGQSERIHRLIQARHPAAETLLDVGCGTAKHIEALNESYRTEGLDINDGLLRVARERCPQTTFHLADMTGFDLGKTFDVVTCLFSAIGYVKTVEGLAKAAGCIARHVSPGGLALVEPWFGPDEYWREHVVVNVAEEPDRKIAWMYSHSGSQTLSVFDVHYLVGTPAGVEHFSERHEMGLFTREQYLDAFGAAGLQAEWDAEGLAGRGLYVGRKG